VGSPGIRDKEHSVVQAAYIARTDLVNFMSDDLVESSLGFPKKRKRRREGKSGEKKRERQRHVIFEYDVALVSRIVFYALSV